MQKKPRDHNSGIIVLILDIFSKAYSQHLSPEFLASSIFLEEIRSLRNDFIRIFSPQIDINLGTIVSFTIFRIFGKTADLGFFLESSGSRIRPKSVDLKAITGDYLHGRRPGIERDTREGLSPAPLPLLETKNCFHLPCLNMLALVVSKFILKRLSS